MPVSDENIKQNLFFYFVLKLKERYYAINKTETKLNRFHVLKMLFIACVYDNDLINWLWGGNFDNFYAMEKWPVEMDCYKIIKGLKERGNSFENTINNKELLEGAIDFYKIDKKTKEKIDAWLKKIPHFLFSKDSSYLVDFTHNFNSWKKAWVKTKIYNINIYPSVINAYPICNNDIIEDGKY